MGIIDKAKSLIFNMNENGIPVPLLRDPSHDQPSITMTMMVISFTLAAGALISKFTKITGDIDTSGANYLFMITSGLYLGRKMQGNGKDLTVDKDESPKP